MRLSFSIVINTLNRAPFLENALASLRQLRHPNFEVIVVNGPSTDNTMDVLAQHADVKVLQCPEANLSMSRNIGIEAAAGDIVCFLDDDAVAEPAWLDRIEAAYADERVGAAGGYIRDHTGVSFQCRAIVCDRMGDSQNFDDQETATAAIGEVTRGAWRFPSQTGANSTFRRKALLEVGGFDEHFVYFLDETDVNLRVMDAGWRIRYAEGAEVHHKYAPSAQRDHRRVPNSLYHPFRSKAYFACKHARGHKTLAEIFDYLANHVMDISRHNSWYYKNKWIDQAHYDRLTDDMDRGLRDGVAAAFAQNKTKREFSEPPPFKRFETFLPNGARMRIAFLSQEYPPGAVGGIGMWTHTLARALAAAGHEITVITRSKTGHATVDFEDGVWVHRIVQEWQPERQEPPLGDLPQVIKDYCYAAYDEVRRVHQIRGLSLVSWPIWDLEGAAVATSGLVPVVMSLHTTFQMALPSKPDWQNNVQYKTQHVDKIIAGEKRFLLEAPFILGNSQAILDDCERAYGLSLDRPGVAAAAHGLEDMSLVLAPRQIDRSKRRLLFVGRLEHRKGADTLLAALPQIMDGRGDLEVRIIGRDDIGEGGASLKDAFLKRWAQAPWLPRVKFEGECDRNTVLTAYRDCDVFVAPSRYESFGLVAVEAMMFARPVVGARAGGLAEVIQHEKTGLLAEPGDAASLAENVARLIDDPILQRAYGTNGRKRFEELYSVEAMRDSVARIYGAIVFPQEPRALETA